MAKKMSRMKAALAGAIFAVSALAVPASLPEQMADLTIKDTVMTASAADSENYAKLLQYSMYFYDANMCGNAVSEMTGLDWRSDCHTADDADGGFHDAGDHAMFGLPQGYTASTIGWSFYEFKDAYEATGQTAHFQTITDYFCRFFKASTVLDDSGNVTNFCYQKGNGDTDHAYWGSPESQGNVRDQYWTSSGASDIAAEYAAALALNYLNFGNEEDLTYAKALYAFSTKYNVVATDGPKGFYNSTGYTDDQAWAAGWLYLATNDASYKSDCQSKQASGLGSVHCWDNVSLGAACVLAHITGDWSTVNSYLSGKCTDPNTYLFLDSWGSARYNATMQLCALAATKNSSADYSEWCKGQMNYLLGDNPADTCFVVGFTDNSAKNPHHRAASGLKNWTEFNSSTTISATNGHVLVGALVGGPSDASGTYQDSIQDYNCNEVACDYNAGLVGAAAGLYSIYQTGSVESSIDGVTKIYDSSSTAPDPNETLPTETETEVSEGQGKYTLELGEKYTYSSMTEKMIGWEWASFGIPEGERPIKVEVNISKNSSTTDYIGTWKGAFGTSTNVDPDYWTQSAEMELYMGDPTGTVTWEIDEATQEIIQLEWGGQLKWGVWWIDCGRFIVDSVVVYTDGGSSTEETTDPTEESTETTEESTETTEESTETTEESTETTETSSEAEVLYGDVNSDGTVNISDVLTLNKNLLAGEELSEEGVRNADVDRDGNPTASDALNILKYTVKIIDTLPIA